MFLDSLGLKAWWLTHQIYLWHGYSDIFADSDFNTGQVSQLYHEQVALADPSEHMQGSSTPKRSSTRAAE